MMMMEPEPEPELLWCGAAEAAFGTLPLWAAGAPGAAATFTAEGAVGVQGVLSAALAAAAAAEVDSALLLSAAAAARDVEQEMRYLGHVRERTQRWDLRLHFCGAVREAVLAAVGAAYPLLTEMLSDEALVCELACLVSDPGAPRQRLHADTQISDKGWLLTMFIALQDIDSTMGGTVVVPSTHSEAAHAELAAVRAQPPPPGGCPTDEVRWMEQHGALRFEGCAGDALLIDSRVLHCGGANTSAFKVGPHRRTGPGGARAAAVPEAGRRRRLLYLTLKVPYCAPGGSTWSILPEYAGLFRLRTLPAWREQPAAEQGSDSPTEDSRDAVAAA